jgi:DeoR/GlpR family transcriptional regulator of sugar metabolism
MSMTENNERTQFILQELLTNGEVSVDTLTQRFGVNSSTIRRDLERLERQNLLRRVHGGAVRVDTLSYSAYANDLTFQTNSGRQLEEKNRIAQAALQLVEPGDTIALSPGTTTTYLARLIRTNQIANLTVVTNAVNIAMELTGLRGLNLLLTGGLLLPDFFALVGPTAEQSLSSVWVKKAFVGVTGLSVANGLTGPNQLEVLTHRLTLQRTEQPIVLADHTKLGQVALYQIAPVEAARHLITGKAAPPEILRELETVGLAVQTV